ncbi:glycosyltransferase [Pseudodesulfovibrio sp. F-1]|uniref:Glycosyltransferase n=1 Tax=Pseudodesulfovibrio alkaliphilus TaxID=2661613 RepID=A0A7K1KN74_9BACT|nr:glycosyltransferase family 2 protein [Pseudodesulfovibrio alkaliphilus]MUM77538.1 glycosyltransferase [Pseudodesulfovibrio alkaliphilus]
MWSFQLSEVTLISPCKVSIVIPLYNRVELTGPCWKSILSLTPRTLAWETVFVDNASSDATTSLIAELASAHPGLVRSIHNEENLGFACACNQGAQAAQGEYIVFLNNDTLVHPGWLEPLVEELDSHPETGVVGARLLYPNGIVQHAGVVIARTRIPYHIFLDAKADAPLVSCRRAFRMVTAACMALRRTEFLAHGGFDEEYVNGHEDVDLCLRYWEAGQWSAYRPESVVTHLESQSEGRFTHCQANTERTLLKWYGKLVQDDYNYQFIESERRKAERPLTVVFKVPASNRRAAPGLAVLRAEELARELCRRGHACRIDFSDDWGLKDLDADATVVIPGQTPYVVKPWSRSVLWPLADGALPDWVNPDDFLLILAPEIDDYDSLEARLVKLAGTLVPQCAPAPAAGTVSVLMATHDRREFIGAAIRSVLAQTVADWELVIVNDGGESVSEVIEAFNDPRIRYFDAPHRSKGHAINMAFAHSLGAYVAYLDDDDVWLPDHLEQALLTLGSLPGVQMTYSDMIETTLERSGAGWKTVRRRPLPAPQAVLADLLECNCIPGITVVHERKLFELVGGMDPDLEVLVDFDLWRRLAVHCDPYHIPALTAERFFRREAGSGEQITDMSTTNRQRYLLNHCRILRKKLPDVVPAVIREELDGVRRKVEALFLDARAEHHAARGDSRRAAACRNLAAKIALNLSRDLMRRLYHADK